MIIRYAPTSAFRSNVLSAIGKPRFPCSTTPIGCLARRISQTSNVRNTIAGPGVRLRDGYFSANGILGITRGSLRRENIATAIGRGEAIEQTTDIQAARIPQPPPAAELPHRKRQRELKENEAAQTPQESFLPTNASSKLTNTASAAPQKSLRRLLPILLSLTKPRLTILVVLTACASYSLYPVPDLLFPSLTATPSLSPLTLLFLTTGTAACAACANTFNMLYEPKWDALMSRTRNRPLVRKLISTRGAMIFAILSGIAGTGALYFGVNPTVSFLGALNIALYAGVYTPLKRISVLNTWVGAIVGGIPPLMGWAAAGGQSATEGTWQELLLGEQNLGGWILASLLVGWQFAHFMALSWSIKDEYKNAGYRMLCWVNPKRNGRVALRYSLLMLPLCVGLCAVGVTEWSFAVASAPVNIWLVREAVRFWRYEGLKGSARGLFWASVWHLPAVLVLAMVEKKGMWQRVWRAVMGAPDLDEEDWLDEDEEDAVLSAKHLSPEAEKIAVARTVR